MTEFLSVSSEQEAVSLFSPESIAELSVKNTSREGDDFREAIFVRFASGKRLAVKLAQNAFTNPNESTCGGAAPMNIAVWAITALKFFLRSTANFRRCFTRTTNALPMRRNFRSTLPPTAAPTPSPFGKSCTE